MTSPTSLLLRAVLALCVAAPLGARCDTAAPPGPATTQVSHLPWTRAANIYEVNIRQYTKQGTLNAFATQLPRLKRMGVDVVWLMPLHPIGKQNRKGALGSYYAVQDYTAVNPDFGTLDDLRRLVRQAHALGMHVMLDWVANHTAWDNPWASAHPDWYKKNARGEIYSVTFTNEHQETEEWTDVTGLDFGNRDLWRGMTEAMAFWVREADIDGFRCDAAGLVPTPFWDHARAELDKIKPMFMLAEWSTPELHERAFDMTYALDLLAVLRKIGKGEGDARDLSAYLAAQARDYPRDAYRMLFTSNHDINSWVGTDAELYGPAQRALAMLTFTLPGMPLIYGGQEAGLDKRLEFFEKDTINWKTRQNAGFYADLIRLKKQHRALWNGQAGGAVQVQDSGNDKVFAFQRRQGDDFVSVAVNLSKLPQQYSLDGKPAGKLAPWAWRIITAPRRAGRE